MVLPERDLVDAEPLQRRVDRRPEVFGRAVEAPAAAVRPDVAALGGEQDLRAQTEFVEQPGDEPLVLALSLCAEIVSRAVGVGGVEQADARVHGGADRGGKLLTRLRTALVEGHQAESDRAHALAADGVVADLPNLHRRWSFPAAPAHTRWTDRQRQG